MTATYTEPAREIPVSHDVDVVVAGGGSAGVAAAVCAARLGLSVVMVERTAQPGGIVSHVTSWLNDFDNKGGFPKEFRTYILETGICVWPYCNPFALVPYFDRLLEEAGVTPLYLTYVAAPMTDGDTLTGVIVESKSGRHGIRAKMVLDTTGDGDVAAMAGADFLKGRDEDGACQAVSLSHMWINYTGGRLENEQMLETVKRAAEAAGTGFKLAYDRGALGPLCGHIPVLWNGRPHVIGFDPLDAESQSAMLVALRRQSMDFLETMNGNAPGFERMFCGPFSGIPGVRESRRIVCDDHIAVERALEGKKLDEGIFTIAQNIDIHMRTPDDPPIVVKKVKPYSMTFGAMLPKGLENLAVAGRCIGGDHEALASYRIIADCFGMGEALAVGCRMALDSGTTLRAVDPKAVAAEMKQRGYEV